MENSNENIVIRKGPLTTTDAEKSEHHFVPDLFAGYGGCSGRFMGVWPLWCPGDEPPRPTLAAR